MKKKFSNQQYIDFILEFCGLFKVVPSVALWKKQKPTGAPCVRAYEKRFGTWNKAIEEAGLIPNKKSTNTRLVTVCTLCGIEIQVQHSNVMKNKNGRFFCCRSHWISWKNTNLGLPRMKVQGRCSKCSMPISKGKRNLCFICKPLISKGHIESLTLEEASLRGGSNRYARIREHARRVALSNLPNMCKICAWDEHIEACHIKAISSFDKATTVASINSIDNLVLLCPNHHWLLDHGKLNLT